MYCKCTYHTCHVYCTCFDRYHHVYFDNFFSGVDLLIELRRRGLYSCGTLRCNRKGFPDDLKPIAKKGLSGRGESVTRQCDELTVSVWQDNRPVVVIATNSDPTEPSTVNRKLRDGTATTIPCPQSVVSYNKHMGGVDRSDQLRGYYHVRLKGRKCYKYIFWFLFDLVITNSYILCTKHTHLNITSTKQFRSDLAKALIGRYCSRKRPGRPSLSLPPATRFCADHFPVRGAEKGHRCTYCHNHHSRRQETVWYCNTCKKFLCHNGREDDCFLAFHKQL